MPLPVVEEPGAEQRLLTSVASPSPEPGGAALGPLAEGEGGGATAREGLSLGRQLLGRWERAQT